MPATTSSLEMWGGVECTVNRVRDQYIDQLVLTGHHERDEDIGLVASLGIRTLRYPVNWERTAGRNNRLDWTWSDARLAALRARGIAPIIGLVHHGSGPPGTSLLDPGFPAKLAAFAGECARRYPWIEMVTPVNEPLTTARFSGLYGHWYPHASNDRAFAHMLLNQCRATRATMRAIRVVSPAAQLVHTEDLGYTHSTNRLRYQAEFENQRRWLSTDLLCGRVDPSHALYGYLRACGISRDELTDLVRDPCPPDILGINHYVTSERYLDHRLDFYPPSTHGGNGHERYADTEAARYAPGRRRGLGALLDEAWQRYGITIALTENHLSCDDELERMRWLHQSWIAACEARARGCDVRAVTAWALFGLRGWDRLVTSTDGNYEPGAFDASDGVPRETQHAEMVRALARTGRFDHPDVAAPGWWNSESRDGPAVAINLQQN